MAFTLTFNTDGGSSVQALTYSNNVTLYQVLNDIGSNPTKENYVFGGWYFVQNSERRFYDLYWEFDSNTTLNAWWYPKEQDEYHYYVKLLHSNDQSWVTNTSYTSPTHNDWSPASAPQMQYLLWGKTINYVKLMMTNWYQYDTRLTLCIFDKEALVGGATGISPIETRVITIPKVVTGDKSDIIVEFDDLEIETGKILAVGLANDTARYYINNGVNTSSNTRTFNGPTSSVIGRGTLNIRNAVVGTQDVNKCYYRDINMDFGYKGSIDDGGGCGCGDTPGGCGCGDTPGGCGCGDTPGGCGCGEGGCDEPYIDPTVVTGVRIVPQQLEDLQIGSTATISAEVIPDTAANKNVMWTIVTGDPSIDIEQDSSCCIITAVKKGTATVRVMTQAGGFMDDISVNIVPRPTDYYKVTSNNKKLQVESAIRDGLGRKIHTTYYTKDEIDALLAALRNNN